MKNTKTQPITNSTNEIINNELIIGKADKKTLSKLQISFNNYIEKINALREELINVDKSAIYIRTKIDKEISPLEKEFVEKRKIYIHKLVNGLKYYKLSKKETEEAIDIICAECQDLISKYGQKDLIKIYDEYNEMTFEEEVEEEKRMMKMHAEEMLRNHFNADNVPDYSTMNDEDFFADFLQQEEKMKEKQEKIKEERNKNKKKTSKQLENALKKQVEEELKNKSLRAIYTDLAKELHPDKETDEAKREQKNEIMKRITVAYNDKNLYELLRLQIEYNQMKDGLSDIAEERLQIYVKVLQEQTAALRAELQNKIHNYSDEMVVKMGLGGTNQQIGYKIGKYKKELTQQLKSIDEINKDFTDPKKMKAYLKNSMAEFSPMSDLESMLESFLESVMNDSNKKR